jgi:hypothetical protein
MRARRAGGGAAISILLGKIHGRELLKNNREV